MKSLILTCLVAIGSSTLSIANEGNPLDAVKAMIRGANKREIVAVDLKKVNMTANQIINLFHDTNADEAIFVDWAGGKGQRQMWMQDEKDPNLYTLRMGNPMCIGFEVRFTPNEKEDGKGTYQVVKIIV